MSKTRQCSNCGHPMEVKKATTGIRHFDSDDSIEDPVVIYSCSQCGKQEICSFFRKTYEFLGQEIGRMVDEKQEAYGDSFGNAGKVLEILYPSGINVDQYDDALAVVRIIDKLFRIATDKDAFGENPFRDIVGYGLLGGRDG